MKVEVLGPKRVREDEGLEEQRLGKQLKVVGLQAAAATEPAVAAAAGSGKVDSEAITVVEDSDDEFADLDVAELDASEAAAYAALAARQLHA